MIGANHEESGHFTLCAAAGRRVMVSIAVISINASLNTLRIRMAPCEIFSGA